MIKINLNKTRSADTGQEETKMTGLTSVIKTSLLTSMTALLKKTHVEDIPPGTIVKAVVKLILVACFPLGLKFYEINQITELKKEKTSMDQSLSSIQKQLTDLKTEIQQYGWLQEKSEEYVKKKEFLKKLADKRLIIPQTIDFIQNNTPTTVWLESLKLSIEKEQRKISIRGKSFSESHVNSFANSLHGVVDKNSITVNTQDIQGRQNLVKVQFDLMGEILL